MSKNEKITQVDNLGEVNITTNILESIANQAAQEIEGVCPRTSGVESFLSGSPVSVKKNEADQLVIDVKIDVYFGYSIPEVAIEIQNNIKEQILYMTDLTVEEVNVHIEEIYPQEFTQDSDDSGENEGE